MANTDENSLMRMLRSTLEAHGAEVAGRGSWLVSSTGVGICAELEVLRDEPGRTTVRIDVDVSLPDGELITESFAGVGTMIQDAVLSAFETFNMGIVHVLLAAFWNRPADSQVEAATWTIDGEQWQVFLGAPVGRGDCIEQESVPEALVVALQGAVRASRLYGNVHWFRAFAYGRDSQMQPIECLQDNEPWSCGAAELAKVRWPSCQGYGSIRQFLILKRVEQRRRLVLAERESIAEGLAVLQNVWSALDATDADGYRRLFAVGIEPELAEKLLFFAPAGYASVLFADVPVFPAAYQVRDGYGRLGHAAPFHSDPLFLAARKSSQQATPDERAAIASRSLIFHVLRELLSSQAGLSEDDLRRLEPPPLVLDLPRFRPPPPMAKRPWWKLWS